MKITQLTHHLPHAVSQHGKMLLSFGLVSTLVACSHMPTEHTHSQTAKMPEAINFSGEKQQFCTDFLKKLDKKPLQVRFEGCSAGFYSQHHSVIANYRVAGKHAFDVQEFLHGISGMPRLVKDCCVWESVDNASGSIGGTLIENGETYFVRMKSKELRLGWNISSDMNNISEFQVQVIYPLALNKHH